MSESERYRRIIEDSRDGFWVLDLEGNLLEVNQAYADMSGYGVDELVNMHVAQLDAQDDERQVKARIGKLLARDMIVLKRGIATRMDICLKWMYQPD